MSARPRRNGQGAHAVDLGATETAAGPSAVVLGGGVAGLYAARVLAAAGARVTLLEAATDVGGLASGARLGGNYHDLGVHHLHAFDEEIFADVRGLMGDQLLPVPKVALVRYGRGYRRYPLEFGDMLRGIPPWILFRALVGMTAQMARNRWRPTEPADAEEALVQLYGRPLYEFFFRDFTTEYWGLAPTELSATFVRRKMPRLSAVDVLKKALGPLGLRDHAGAAVDSAVRDETLWYSRTGAREVPLALAKAIRADGGRVLTESLVTGLEMGEDGSAAAVAFERHGRVERVACDLVLSTIPLPALVAACGPAAPDDVQASAAALEYKPIAVYGLLVSRPRVLDALYVYFRERVFHRVAEPSLSGLDVHPPGHTLLLAELTCDEGDAAWCGTQAAIERVIEDLAAEGLVAPEEVVDVQLRRSAHGYPIFRRGFEAHLARVEGFLATVPNLRSTGRQGGFCYPNMHGAMRMGADAARELLARAPAHQAAAAVPAHDEAVEPVASGR